MCHLHYENDHDVLLAGFPCQPSSIAGVLRKSSMGRLDECVDKAQGLLFFDVAWIIMAKQPKDWLLLFRVRHPEDGREDQASHDTVGKKAKMDARRTLSPKLWTYLQDYVVKHRTARHRFGFGLMNGDRVRRALSTGYAKDGSESLVSNEPRKRPRRLIPRGRGRIVGPGDPLVTHQRTGCWPAPRLSQ